MTLREIINQLDTLPDDSTIYATRMEEWQLDAPAALVLEEDTIELGVQLEDLHYFLEVYLAKEALKLWSEWRNNALPTEQERLEAVVYYASNDAYID